MVIVLVLISFSNNASGVATNNFYISNGDTCYLQGASGLGIGLSGANIALDGICSFTNTTTPNITNSIPANDATTKILTTSWTNTYFGKKNISNWNYITNVVRK